MNQSKDYPLSTLLGATGFLIGIVYSFKHKSGFWKGAGISILGSIAGSGIGYGLDLMMNANSDLSVNM
jgi:hypothetical protein